MLIMPTSVRRVAGFPQHQLGSHHGSGYDDLVAPVLLAAMAERNTDMRISTGRHPCWPTRHLRGRGLRHVDVLSGGRVSSSPAGALLSVHYECSASTSTSRVSLSTRPRAHRRLWTGEGVGGRCHSAAIQRRCTIMTNPLQQGVPTSGSGGGKSRPTPHHRRPARLSSWLPSAFGPPAKFQGRGRHLPRALPRRRATGTSRSVGGRSWHVTSAARNSQPKTRGRSATGAIKRLEPSRLLKKRQPQRPEYLHEALQLRVAVQTLREAIVGGGWWAVRRGDRAHRARWAKMRGADLHLCYMRHGGLTQLRWLER